MSSALEHRATQAEFPRWPLWMPAAALFCGVSAGVLLLSVLSGVLDAAGVDTDGDSPGITAAGTALIDLSVVAAAVVFAGLVARPRPWQFGFRAAPLRFVAAICGIGVAAYFLFSLLYGAIVRPDEEQTVVEDLGADTNTLLLVTGALVVIVVAPLCEELFFRGVVYRVLRARMPLWIAAVIDGILFGLVHGSLVIAPVLAFLGIVLCYVYERTGTLYATIALHALNNTISYGVNTEDGWVASLVVGLLVLGACVLGMARHPRETAVVTG